MNVVDIIEFVYCCSFFSYSLNRLFNNMAAFLCLLSTIHQCKKFITLKIYLFEYYLRNFDEKFKILCICFYLIVVSFLMMEYNSSYFTFLFTFWIKPNCTCFVYELFSIQSQSFRANDAFHAKNNDDIRTKFRLSLCQYLN